MLQTKSSTQPQKPVILSGSRMLTPSEQELLRQDLKEAHDYGQKVFAHLRPPSNIHTPT